MKKIYFLLFALTANFLTAQTTVNFTDGEGFADGALYNQTGWDSSLTGTTWLVDTSIGALTLSNDWQRAAWGHGFSVSGAGESITFRVDLKFLGTMGTNNNPLIKIGFSSSSDVASTTPPNNGVFLRTANYNSQLQLANNLNSGALSPNASLLIADCQGTGESDDLAVLVTLTLGADADSSTISAKLMNLTDGTESVVGSDTVISADVFAAATTNIYGFLHAQTLTTTGNNAITQIQVSSVTMTNENSLNTESHARSTFNLSQNPIEDIVQLKGVEIGRKISIYSITGAKASNHIYDGSPLNLSHLNTGVYFMQVPGFTTQKLIKK